MTPQQIAHPSLLIADEYALGARLRVEAAVKFALGIFSLQQAADYLAQTVPMDHATALGEAALFAGSPGQAITYQTGKIQITEMWQRRVSNEEARFQC